jgi:hypothetical protein
MNLKSSISDYTEEEFVELLQRIIGTDASEEEENELVYHFNLICGHPDGSDLIFYPEEGADISAQGIVKTLKEWRDIQGLPGFRDE